MIFSTPSRSFRQWGLAVLIVIVAALVAGVVSGVASGRTSRSLVIVDQGRVPGYMWRVAVGDDSGGRGVCIEVAIKKPHKEGGASLNARCANPSPVRGNTRSSRVQRDGRTLLTVFGGAFNAAVGRVQEVMLNGRVKTLAFSRLGRAGDLNRLRYVALAVAGPWCLSELRTLSHSGKILWQVPASELLSYVPAAECK